jgi:hypothetical protein
MAALSTLCYTSPQQRRAPGESLAPIGGGAPARFVGGEKTVNSVKVC